MKGETRTRYVSAKVDLPYPKIEVEGENRIYAQYMLDNLGGIVSEMSAIASYIYEHMLLDGDNYKEIADTLFEISMAEMEHGEIFGELARKLGGDPRLWSKRGSRMRYWSPEYIKYPRDLETILKYNIQEEEGAIKKYRQQASMIRDKYIVALLKRIILDEELHVEIFKELNRKYC